EGVHAVRTGGDDAARAGGVQADDVLLGALLKKELIPEPAGWVAGAAFFGTKDGKVYASLPQQLRRGAGHLLRARVEGGGTADPEERLEAGVLLHRRHVEALRPGEALARRLAMRIPLAGQAAQSLRGRPRQLALADQGAAHAGDQVHLPDQDRALED